MTKKVSGKFLGEKKLKTPKTKKANITAETKEISIGQNYEEQIDTERTLEFRFVKSR